MHIYCLPASICMSTIILFTVPSYISNIPLQVILLIHKVYPLEFIKWKSSIWKLSVLFFWNVFILPLLFLKFIDEWGLAGSGVGRQSLKNHRKLLGFLIPETTHQLQYIDISCPPSLQIILFTFFKSRTLIRIYQLGFPGGSVIKNLAASAVDTGLIPGPGRFHMLQSN